MKDISKYWFSLFLEVLRDGCKQPFRTRKVLQYVYNVHEPRSIVSYHRSLFRYGAGPIRGTRASAPYEFVNIVKGGEPCMRFAVVRTFCNETEEKVREYDPTAMWRLFQGAMAPQTSYILKFCQ